MSDTGDTNSRTPTPELEDREETSENPLPAPRHSLPVRFANPQVPESERPVAEISWDNLFINQTNEIIEFNETLLQNVNQTLASVDNVLVHTSHTLHTNILDQTITMADDGSLLQPNNIETGDSRQNENPVINTSTQNNPQVSYHNLGNP
ncbi:unnamed protein product [Macrosiphum euphorbiae]|uniref:Uncharacterized protein n=1 Tax=Macrosiphum euphorbiae TaxID=13131 RepID=A0AAV0WT13_9HEMI|nr:unnamed protein product [Macrosiphum euphorbiae]